jgi:glycerophosphoryl diester phosphodiesterase
MAAPSWLTARPVAHRGLHTAQRGIVENTLPAALAAVEHGFSIEVDLQLSRDGEVIVFHDDTLERLTTGTGRVAARTAAELADIPFKVGTARIPTLAELLDTVAGRVPLVLELKSQWVRDPGTRLIAGVVAELAAYDGPVAAMSFDPDLVEGLRHAMPGLTRGIVADIATDPHEYGRLTTMERFALRHLLHAPRSRPDFVAYDVHALPMPGPALLRRVFGKPLLTWTVRTPDELAHARTYADQIIFEGFVPE